MLGILDCRLLHILDLKLQYEDDGGYKEARGRVKDVETDSTGQKVRKRRK